MNQSGFQGMSSQGFVGVAQERSNRDLIKNCRCHIEPETSFSQSQKK